MNQMSHNVIAFQNARPLSESEQNARLVSGQVYRAQPAGEHERATGFGKPSVFALLVEGIKRYLAHRRTIRALDRLSNEQLKDIGYRRIPDGYSKYEPMP